jgi:CRP-like cAMP-binding protein
MRSNIKNQFLKQLTEAELLLIREGMERVQLSLGEALYELHKPMTHLYFPEDSMISLVTVTSDGLTVEVGVVGSEGILGIGAMFEHRSLYQGTVQASGVAYKVKMKALRDAFGRSERLQNQLMDYLLSVHNQVTQSAICNKFHGVQERLAKWLMLCADRTGVNSFRYTQEFLSMMLGARRTTVSRTLKALQALGVIEMKRRKITILREKQLAALSCECYEVVRAEFQRAS